MQYRHKVLGYSDSIAELSVKYQKDLDSIEETGLYRNVLTSDWELWHVEDNHKMCIGVAAPTLSIDSVRILWDEYLLFSQTGITSVYDIYDSSVIQ